MLIEFSVGNFRSFRDPITFSMVAANITAKNKTLNQHNLFNVKSNKLLKSAAIYGANASGKSNLLAAFGFMRGFVLGSTESNSEAKIGVEPFMLETSTLEQPSYFEVIFQADDVRYRYGFEATANKIQTEWLFRTKSRESELFWRENDCIEVKSGFKECNGLEERTRKNVLFLSVCDQWNGEIANRIIQWFKGANIVSGIEDQDYLAFTVSRFIEDTSIQSKIRHYMQQLDLGISEVFVERIHGIPDGLREKIDNLDKTGMPQRVREAMADDNKWFAPSIKFSHQQHDESNNKIKAVEFDFEEQESEGTQKAFALSGPILHTLSEGKILFIDELDARFHPLMTKYIIKLFNSAETNKKNAQLIFVTHDTNHLTKELFRRDQIWFTEKDRFGNSNLYSLVEYKKPKGVRNDASYDSDYISGKYGAIPYLGNISYLTEEENGKA